MELERHESEQGMLWEHEPTNMCFTSFQTSFQEKSPWNELDLFRVLKTFTSVSIKQLEYELVISIA